MSNEHGFWRGLSARSRYGLIAGSVAILAITASAGWWLLRTDYQVLFSDLKAQDAQAMTTELERLKIPYRLEDAGGSILVDKSTVHATRLKLMGKDLPLHGAVGLELFNNTDFGMTEFAQKINYQRALQGEITRTIQSLAEVRDVRVLLALPEQGLFKQATSKAKASITLSLKQGRALRAEQVTGIQRLVAAAVPGMTTRDVTIVDNQGLALTRAEAGDGDAELSGARLELKRETEAYLAGKVGDVLERTFGAGQALASVDVTLNMDLVRTTTEDVLPASARSGMQSTGVVVREREVLRDAGSASETKVLDANAGRGGSAQRDVEYAVGRRVEQVVSQPGSIRRIHVVAVVRKGLDAIQEDQLRKVIAAAAGASPERGDTVVVQSLAEGATEHARQPQWGEASDHSDSDIDGGSAERRWWQDRRHQSAAALGLLALLALAVMALGLSAWRRRTPVVTTDPASVPPPPLSDAKRAVALNRIQAWMNEVTEAPHAADAAATTSGVSTSIGNARRGP